MTDEQLQRLNELAEAELFGAIAEDLSRSYKAILGVLLKHGAGLQWANVPF